MCLSKYSNLEHLREVANNLFSSEDHENRNLLCERELAALINTYYQEGEDTSSGEKRKNEIVSDNDNKKLRVNHEVSATLSNLELLPNEVYDMILKNLGGEAKNNLRSTCTGLYHKTTSLAPMYENWCFDATKGTPPDFVLKTNRNCCVYAIGDLFPTGITVSNNAFDTAANLFNRFAHRISSIRIERLPNLMNSLQCMRPAEFPHLTSLDLESVRLDNDSLLMLAPQLEHLSLACMRNQMFDISTVDEESKCFTKLKTLKLFSIEIDVRKILSKCCHSLKYLDLDSLSGLDLLEQELYHLKHAVLHLYPDPECTLDSFRNLLSKCSRSLETLKLGLRNNIALCKLLDQPLKITTLELMQFNTRIEEKDIVIFFNKCPLVQKLILTGFNIEMTGIVLKDLIYLRLQGCGAKCMTSVLEQASKYSLKTVYVSHGSKAIIECQFPVISKLDKLYVHLLIGWYQDTEDDQNQALDNVIKLFPSNIKLAAEIIKGTQHYKELMITPCPGAVIMNK